MPRDERQVFSTHPLHLSPGARIWLGLALILIAVTGVFEAGRLYIIAGALRAAAKDAVDYGAQAGANPAGLSYVLDCEGMYREALKMALLGGFSASDIEIRLMPGPRACPVAPEPGDSLVVTVHTRFRLVPFVPWPSIRLDRTIRRPLETSAPTSLTPSLTMPSLAAPQSSSPILSTGAATGLSLTLFATGSTPTTSISAFTSSPLVATLAAPITSTPTTAPGSTTRPTTPAMLFQTRTISAAPTLSSTAGHTPTRTPSPTRLRTATKTATQALTETPTPCPYPAESGGCP